MFLQTRKYSSLLIAFSLAVAGCGDSRVETQLIEQNAQEKVSFPPEVMDAMKAEIDEVEVPVDVSEGGVSKPSGFSKLYIIDYQDRSEPTYEAPSPDVSTTCGTSSAFNVKKLRWTTFPITYAISTTNLTDGVDPVAAKAAVVNALNTWESEEHPIGDLFVEAQDGETPKLTVRWGPIDGKNKVLAITENTFNNVTKVIISSRMAFDTGDTWKVFPSADCKSQGSENDIENVAAHEVGHAIGLLHPPTNKQNKPLTMYAFSSPGETFKRTLAKGDQIGLARLYPTKKK